MGLHTHTHTDHHIMVEKGRKGMQGQKSPDSQVRVHCAGERMVEKKRQISSCERRRE